MTQIDQFESAFKAASRTVFSYARVTIDNVMIVTDLDEYQTRLFGDRVRSFLKVLGDDIEWHDAKGDQTQTVGDMLDQIEAQRPDLICSYRNLHSGGWRWPYSLGEHLDVLTQVTSTPVLVLPRPDAEQERFEAATDDTNSVMVITDHLTGDHRLINYAARFTEKKGTMRLTHIESEEVFERYIGAISKIPAIDTEVARKEIRKRLLKDPLDYIASATAGLAKAGLPFSVEAEVTIGKNLAFYKRLIAEHEVDLLVLNTKDADQMAMHGRAYPLAIELRHTPLLML